MGEFVVIVGGKPEEEILPDYDAAERIFNESLAKGLSRTDAVKEAARQTGLRKNDLYNRFVK